MNEQYFGPHCTIHSADIQNADIAHLAKALSDNNVQIVERLNATAQKYLQRGEVTGCEPPFARSPEFLAQHRAGWYPMLWSRLGQNSARGSSISTLFPLAVYLYECYGLTPSKFILGYEALTIVPKWLQTWLYQVSKMSLPKKDALYNILGNGTYVRHNTVYILKERLSELATVYGVPTEDFILYPGILPSDSKIVAAFAKLSFQEMGEQYSVIKPFLGNHKLLRMLICICAKYDVTPEYLLLQDYSDFAVTENGIFYPPSTRDLISKMLTADAATRSKAIGFVMAESVHVIADKTWKKEHPDKANCPETSSIIDKLYTEVIVNTVGASRKTEKHLIDTLKENTIMVLTMSQGPVSTQKIHSLVNGHSRLIRRALTELKAEGRVESVPRQGTAPYWQLAKKN